MCYNSRITKGTELNCRLISFFFVFNPYLFEWQRGRLSTCSFSTMSTVAVAGPSRSHEMEVKLRESCLDGWGFCMYVRAKF